MRRDSDRWLVMQAGGARGALPLRAVGALSAPLPLHPVPLAPAAVLGLAEWHGRLVTVVDFARWAGSRPPGGSGGCLVVLAYPHAQLALRVDSAELQEQPPGTDGQDAPLVDPAGLLRTLSSEASGLAAPPSPRSR